MAMKLTCLVTLATHWLPGKIGELTSSARTEIQITVGDSSLILTCLLSSQPARARAMITTMPRKAPSGSNGGELGFIMAR